MIRRVLEIQKVGPDLVLDVTELAEELQLAVGDQVLLERTPAGFEISPNHSPAANARKIARNFMTKYPSAMKKLAD